MNVNSGDSIVAEYLIYRGFTQTFRSLESERRRDKTKQYEAIGIVEVRSDLLVISQIILESIPFLIFLSDSPSSNIYKLTKLHYLLVFGTS